MAYQQPAGMACLGHECRLPCRGMPRGLCPFNAVVAESGFMVKQGDAFEILLQVGLVGRIGAVGITARSFGGTCKPAVGYDGTVGQSPVGTVLDIVDFTERNAVEIDHFTPDMGQGRLLPEQIAATGDAVVKRKGGHTHRAVVVDGQVAGRVDRVEHGFKPRSLTEEIQLPVEQFLVIARCIDVQPGRAPQQSEGRNQPHQTETMVTVKVGDEYVAQIHEVELLIAHLHLRPLSAVNHGEFLADVDDL